MNADNSVAFMVGNVGIGVKEPTEILHVQGNIQTTGKICESTICLSTLEEYFNQFEENNVNTIQNLDLLEGNYENLNQMVEHKFDEYQQFFEKVKKLDSKFMDIEKGTELETNLNEKVEELQNSLSQTMDETKIDLSNSLDALVLSSQVQFYADQTLLYSNESFIIYWNYLYTDDMSCSGEGTLWNEPTLPDVGYQAFSGLNPGTYDFHLVCQKDQIDFAKSFKVNIQEAVSEKMDLYFNTNSQKVKKGEPFKLSWNGNNLDWNKCITQGWAHQIKGRGYKTHKIDIRGTFELKLVCNDLVKSVEIKVI